jgi:hypothetical protein
MKGAMLRPAMLARRPAVFLGAVVALVVVTAAVSAAAQAGGHRQGGPSQRVSVGAGPVTAVDLQAVPGHLSVVSTGSGRASLTGVLDWTRHAPIATTRVSGHRLSLSYRCAAQSPCTADWRLVVPRQAAVTLRVPAGYVIMTGLAGPLQITAGSVDISATRLACPRLTAMITSGHLGAVFSAPPRQVGISLRSAQATLALPASVTYAVSDQVSSGYIQVAIPESASADHTVTARVVSGELELRPT